MTVKAKVTAQVTETAKVTAIVTDISIVTAKVTEHFNSTSRRSFTYLLPRVATFVGTGRFPSWLGMHKNK